MDTDKIFSNFKTAPWYIKSKEETILLTGVGGIGSNTIMALGKTIPAKYFIIDDDIVETHNIGTQAFRESQIGQTKVQACCDNIDYKNIIGIKKLVKNEYNPITIMGFDNMKARKLIFDNWKEKEDREILIDGRLRANFYEVFVVTKGRERKYEKTLFDDNEVDTMPCTYKQTAYFGMLIGARITHVLCNYLINKYSEEPYCVVPFKIEELGDMFFNKLTL